MGKEVVYTELAEKIDKFVEKYAGIRPDYDPEYDDIDDKYTSPDAYEMVRCSMLLKKGIRPDCCRSFWSSGGYIPHGSLDGKMIHEGILDELKYI